MDPAPRILFRTTRSVGDVLNATFSFIRQNIWLLGKSLLYITGPAVALMAAFTAFFQVRMFQVGFMADTELSDAEALNVMSGFLGTLGGVMVFGMITTVLAVSVVLGFMRLYDRHGPDGFGVDDVWAEVKALAGPVLGVSLLFGLAMLLPLPIVIIPCLGFLAYLAWLVWAGFTFSLAYPIRVMEGAGTFEAFGRARQLVKGSFWPTAGALFLTYLIYSVLTNAFAMPAFIVAMLYGFHSLEGGEGGLVYQAVMFVATVLQTVASTALYCIPLVAVTLQYFNLVEQHEHAGLFARIDAVTQGDDTPSRPAIGPDTAAELPPDATSTDASERWSGRPQPSDTARSPYLPPDPSPEDEPRLGPAGDTTA